MADYGYEINDASGNVIIDHNSVVITHEDNINLSSGGYIFPYYTVFSEEPDLLAIGQSEEDVGGSEPKPSYKYCPGYNYGTATAPKYRFTPGVTPFIDQPCHARLIYSSTYNFAHGEWVQIGRRRYRFMNTPSRNYDVTIGTSSPNVFETIFNLKRAVNADTIGAVTWYYPGTPVNDDLMSVENYAYWGEYYLRMINVFAKDYTYDDNDLYLQKQGGDRVYVDGKISTYQKSFGFAVPSTYEAMPVGWYVPIQYGTHPPNVVKYNDLL